MTFDWQRLIDIRERRRKIALEALVIEQRAVGQSRMQLQSAQAVLQQRVSAKSGHWSAIRHAMTAGEFNVSQLRDATAWGSALDVQIAHQDRIVQQAHAVMMERQQGLAVRRRAVHAAAASVAKAQRMLEREQLQQQRLDELRNDAVIDDLASSSWTMQRSAQAGGGSR